MTADQLSILNVFSRGSDPPRPSRIGIRLCYGLMILVQSCYLTLPSAPPLRSIETDLIVRMRQQSMVRREEGIQLALRRVDRLDKLLPRVSVYISCRLTHHSSGQIPVNGISLRSMAESWIPTIRAVSPEKVDLFLSEEEYTPKAKGDTWFWVGLGVCQGQSGSPGRRDCQKTDVRGRSSWVSWAYQEPPKTVHLWIPRCSRIFSMSATM